MPPVPAGLTMLPAEMALRPDVTPFLPTPDALLPNADPNEVLRLKDGDIIDLDAELVRRTIDGQTFTMYSYNGQNPGPLIEVSRGSEIMVRFTNHLEDSTSIHWHGIRLENPFDGAEEEIQEPPLLWPAIPSRESYVASLEAFEAVYLSRKNPASEHAWYYVRRLGGDSAGVRTSDEKPEQKHQAVLKQIASRKQLLKPSEKWERPGSVARCLLVAIRDEEVETSKLDQVLAPFWLTVWLLAARGHWLRHERQPVRPAGPNEDDFRRRIILPDPLCSCDLKLSFTGIGCPELGMSIDLGPARL